MLLVPAPPLKFASRTRKVAEFTVAPAKSAGRFARYSAIGYPSFSRGSVRYARCAGSAPVLLPPKVSCVRVPLVPSQREEETPSVPSKMIRTCTAEAAVDMPRKAPTTAAHSIVLFIFSPSQKELTKTQVARLAPSDMENALRSQRRIIIDLYIKLLS